NPNPLHLCCQDQPPEALHHRARGGRTGDEELLRRRLGALEPEGAPSAGGAGDQGVIGDLKDAVGELKQTAAAMGHLRDGDRKFQWANAKTYGSAAITDADTCLDEVLERKVNPVVKKKIRAVLVGLRNL
ncbi:21 kDa protein, partial [Phtheirospermum japonicum]